MPAPTWLPDRHGWVDVHLHPVGLLCPLQRQLGAACGKGGLVAVNDGLDLHGYGGVCLCSLLGFQLMDAGDRRMPAAAKPALLPATNRVCACTTIQPRLGICTHLLQPHAIVSSIGVDSTAANDTTQRPTRHPAAHTSC